MIGAHGSEPRVDVALNAATVSERFENMAPVAAQLES
jgi:hypothetical protein